FTHPASELLSFTVAMICSGVMVGLTAQPPRSKTSNAMVSFITSLSALYSQRRVCGLAQPYIREWLLPLLVPDHCPPELDQLVLVAQVHHVIRADLEPLRYVVDI